MKRGFVFSIVAIVMIGVLVMFMLTSEDPAYSGADPVFLVQQLNAMIDDIEQDIERGVYITTLRTLIGQVEVINSRGAFLLNQSDSFREGMLNGTIESISVPILEESTFSLWLEKTAGVLAEKGIAFTFEEPIIDIAHISFDTVNVSVRMQYVITDVSGRRVFNREIDAGVVVSLQGIEDPAYFVKSFGRVSNIVIFSQEDDLLTLIGFAQDNSVYVPSDRSPTILMRLEGNFSAHEHGVESIVDGERFTNNNVFLYGGRSNVDAVYFSDAAHTAQCVSGAPSWFRIDSDRASDYSGVTIIGCS